MQMPPNTQHPIMGEKEYEDHMAALRKAESAPNRAERRRLAALERKSA